MSRYEWIIVLSVILGIYKVSAGVFECSADNDCLGDSKCENYKCECEPGKILNTMGETCLNLVVGYATACTDSNQCALLGGSYNCKDKKCVCDEGWVYLNGNCKQRKELLSDCTVDEDCFDGVDYLATKCIQQKCECNNGYYSRGGFDCRKSRAKDEYCAVNSDCDFTNGVCHEGICKDSTEAAGGTNRQFLGHFLAVLDDEADEPAVFLNEPCASNSECTTQNSYCSPLMKQCLCSKGYYKKSTKCVPELGSPCTNKTDCADASADCVESVCTCSGRSQHKPGNAKCVKGAFASAFSCSTIDTCRIFGSNFACNNKVCNCLPGYALNIDTLCKPAAAADVCISDDSCDLKIKNSACSATGCCVCNGKSEYNANTLSCDALLGGRCGSSADCKIPDSVCQGNMCVCAKTHAQISSKECVKVASGLGDKCSLDIECSQTFTGSHCQDKLCICQEDHVEINGFCLKSATKAGDYCNNKLLCNSLGDEFACRYGTCQCPMSMKPAKNGRTCESKTGGASKRGLSATLFGGVVIAYSMIVGVFL